jgi:deazaflavin-dependent oxidoreductase (nitroreductase family)
VLTDASDFNRGVIEEFRANGGQVGGELAGATVVLVHHVGARTGIVRVVPLIGTPQGDGRVVVVASNEGSPTHPDWVYNLRAHPTVTVELGVQTLTMQAEELGPAARVDLWPQLLAGSPALRDFEARTAREIPVFVLTPL